ncbi:MAG: GNAT family protein [Candidatus Hydrogenedentes bacterium]|nr:GNAT family protein [Candidatus Hydrogenedentota bacterium]
MELTTNRLLLREFVPDDWPAVLAYQSDGRYLRYTRWDARKPEDVRQMVEQFVAQQLVGPRVEFQVAIVLRGTQELIGNCGIRKARADAHEAELGYEIAPEHWGRGYATEAARAMVEFGFGTLGLHRIAAWCVAENAGSARVLEKIGMRREGVLREKEWMRDRWWDTVVFGMLETEWRG